MAIGSLISNRNFGSFIGSGKVCQTEKASAHLRGEHYSIYAQGKKFYKKLSIPRENYSISRHSFCLFFHAIGSSDEKVLKPIATTYGDGRHPFSMSHQLSAKSHSINPRQNIGAVCKWYLSSDPSHSSWVQPRKLVKVGISDKQGNQYKHVTVNRIRAEYKSEDYDITGAEMDSLNSSEVPSEAVLVGGNVQSTTTWWEQFPKRWMIVLLCFSAFLLCNMDRVNMSIAILPMSQEFNWNSATVGLIQSSFFWGYLLTQIVGGIWADKIGGKLVLGFGVIWWSVATMLTPIAARIGLPFFTCHACFYFGQIFFYFHIFSPLNIPMMHVETF